MSPINSHQKLPHTLTRELIRKRLVYRATGFDAFNLTTPSPMKVTDIAFTGYPVTNMKRAKEFYEGFLGLEKSRGLGQKEGEEQWVEYDVGSSCLALISSAPEQWPPAKAGSPAVALEVDDLDAYRDAAKKRNVKEVFPSADTPMCRMAVIADPDGNWIALHQRKAKT